MIQRGISTPSTLTRVSLGAEPQTMSWPEPNDERADAGQVLHDLQRVALRAGDAPRLLGADAGLDRLLLDARRAHDDRDPLVVVVLLLDQVLHGAPLAG